MGVPVFDAFAGNNSPSAGLHEDMRQEIRDSVRFVSRAGGGVRDVLTSRKSFARTPELLALYGPDQEPWDASSPPPDFAQPERAGLLTRAAFLASASGNTRPIMKGFHVRTALLCQSIPAPPNNAAAMPIELSADLTTREQVEKLTEQQGSSCAGCHRTLLNPMGFVTENFDALGRLRVRQSLFDMDGQLQGEKPVDTRTHIQIGDLRHDVTGAGELVDFMAQTGEFETCFARQYFRYSFNRVEDPARDGCALAALQSEALQGKPLADVLKQVALQPAFQRRDFR